jgi:hypothetical protein
MSLKYSDYSKTYIATASTTQIFTGRGMLHAITIGETAAGAISVIDNTAGSTVNVASLKTSIGEGTYRFDCSIANGLRIITAANSKITVAWSQ